MRALVIALELVVAGCSSSNATSPVPNAVRARPPISARVVLPARAMTAGSSMSGHVVIENDTGRAIHTSGCLTLFQVALVSRSYHPAIAWFACLQSFTIPVGQSSYPVTVAASYRQCSQGGPSDSAKACLAGGHMPSLPPGVYRAVLFQLRHLVPRPAPITVRVTPR